jgi:hypothetical protein
MAAQAVSQLGLTLQVTGSQVTLLAVAVAAVQAPTHPASVPLLQ